MLIRTECFRGIGGEPGGGSYAKVNADFDGGDYLTRGAALTGSALGVNGTLAFWLKLESTTPTTTVVFSQSTSARGLRVTWLNASNILRVQGFQATGTTRLQVDAAAADDGVMRHYYVAFNLANSAQRAFLINGVDASPTWTTYSNNNVAFNHTDFSVGAQVDGNSALIGELAEVFWAQSYLDPATNLASFYDAGDPVDPLGWPAHLVGLHGAIGSWHTNDGTGGGFTLTGTLTEGSG